MSKQIEILAVFQNNLDKIKNILIEVLPQEKESDGRRMGKESYLNSSFIQCIVELFKTQEVLFESGLKILDVCPPEDKEIERLKKGWACIEEHRNLILKELIEEEKDSEEIIIRKKRWMCVPYMYKVLTLLKLQKEESKRVGKILDLKERDKQKVKSKTSSYVNIEEGEDF